MAMVIVYCGSSDQIFCFEYTIRIILKRNKLFSTYEDWGKIRWFLDWSGESGVHWKEIKETSSFGTIESVFLKC
jgi:hypothetical protein